MKIREESAVEVYDTSTIINELRRVVDEGTNVCLTRCGLGLTLSYGEWNRLLNLAEIGLRHEVK